MASSSLQRDFDSKFEQVSNLLAPSILFDALFASSIASRWNNNRKPSRWSKGMRRPGGEVEKEMEREREVERSV